MAFRYSPAAHNKGRLNVAAQNRSRSRRRRHARTIRAKSKAGSIVNSNTLGSGTSRRRRKKCQTFSPPMKYARNAATNVLRAAERDAKARMGMGANHGSGQRGFRPVPK